MNSRLNFSVKDRFLNRPRYKRGRAGGNTSTNLGVGLFMTDEQVPVSLKQNEMVNNWTGLYLGGGNIGNIGLPQGWYIANWLFINGMYLPHFVYSSSTLAWDNHWTASFSSDDVLSAGPFYYPSPNPYTIYARNNSAEWKPSPVDNVPGNFYYEMQTAIAANYLGNISGMDCPTGNAGTQEIVWNGGGIEQYKMMITDTTTQTYEAAYKWSQCYTVYDLLRNTDSLQTNDSLFSAFYTTAFNSNLGKLYRASAGLGYLKDLTTGKITSFKDTLNNIMPANEPETDLISVLSIFADEMLDSSMVIPNDSALIILMTLDSTLSFASANTRLDSAAYVVVKEIANKCPYQYGHAVYIARGLAALNDTAAVVYRNVCETYNADTLSMRLEEQQLQTVNRINENKLYPNPTSNEVYLDYNLQEGEIGSLEVYNSIGQRISKEENIIGVGILKISVARSSPGIYYVRLLVNERQRNNWKLCIARN